MYNQVTYLVKIFRLISAMRFFVVICKLAYLGPRGITKNVPNLQVFDPIPVPPTTLSIKEVINLVLTVTKIYTTIF